MVAVDNSSGVLSADSNVYYSKHSPDGNGLVNAIKVNIHNGIISEHLVRLTR